eukprot:s1063_g6.t1
MSTDRLHGYPASTDSELEIIDVQVVCLNGEGLTLKIPSSTLGRDVRKMVAEKLPSKPGARLRCPSGLQSLTFWSNLVFEQGFENVTLPEGLKSLKLCCSATSNLARLTWPTGLKSLTLGLGQWALDDVTLPASLESLTLDDYFNQSLRHFRLPPGLQSLTFGSQFDQSLQDVTLPSSLTNLTFGDSFNRFLEPVAWPSLKNLTFGARFNRSLERVSLPTTLQSLTFGLEFNQSLEHVTLPEGLSSLTFGTNFNQSLEHVTLPAGLSSLTFGTNFNQSLEHVTLPAGLSSLTFGKNFNQSLEHVTLPCGLKSLVFSCNFNQIVEHMTLPTNVVTLTLEESLEHVTLPSGLQSLTLGVNFNQSLEQVILPPSLQSLTFGSSFNRSLKRVALPSSLKKLVFGDSFNQSLEQVTLPSLESLIFGRDFNQNLEGLTLPSSLRTLTFGREFNQSLEAITYPSGLQNLKFEGESEHRYRILQGRATFPSNLKSFSVLGVVLEPKEAGHLANSLISWPAWRVGFQDGLMPSNMLSDELKARFQEAQAALTLGPRARALAKLRELTYCSRPQLLSYWQALDTEGVGIVDKEHWATAMRAVVISDDDFPWEWLEPYMLRTTEGNQFNYAVFLAQYGNALARKLAARFYGGSMMAVLPGVKSKADIEQAWSTVDRNGDGRLSYQELRPLLRASSGLGDGTDKITMEDHIYSLLMVMDKDKTGFVDREEFISCVMRFLSGESLVNSVSMASMHSSFEADIAAAQAARKAEAEGGASAALNEEMAKWTDEEISQCWASTQGVIRALSTTTGCASAVFQVLDEDSDGAIDREEFRKGLRQLLAGNNMLRNMHVWEPLLWKLVDEDSSGVVSPHEMNLAFSVRETLSI